MHVQQIERRWRSLPELLDAHNAAEDDHRLAEVALRRQERCEGQTEPEFVGVRSGW